MKSEYRRTADDVTNAAREHAHEYCHLHWTKQFVLAMEAGAFICFGALLTVFFTLEIEESGTEKLYLALGFVAGFTLVILSGAALFTEINVILPLKLFHCYQADMSREEKIKELKLVFRFWGIVYLGNLCGALLVALMVYGADAIPQDDKERLIEMVASKTVQVDNGAAGWFRTLLSAMIGNWLVGMAAFNAVSGRTIPGKVIGLLFPVTMFSAMGFQHTPANMGYLFLALINTDTPLTTGQAIGSNLIPATIGNVIGALVFVAMAFDYAYRPGPGGLHLAGKNGGSVTKSVANEPKEVELDSIASIEEDSD